MSIRDMFWLCAGLLTAGALAFVLPGLLRAAPAGSSRVARAGVVAACSAVFVLFSVGLYQILGEPRALDRAGVSTDPHVTARGTADAPAGAADIAHYRDLVSRDPRDAVAWLAIAQLERGARNFAASKAAFDHAIELGSMSATAWADYADVLGTLDGSLAGAAAALDRALALDERHMKALWLKASLAIEERRHDDALELWIRLRSLIADASADARIIDANIAEARALLAEQGAATPAKPAASAAIRGTVDVDPQLKSRLTADMTLFVFAKSVDSPGPPLAVLRTRPASWPVSFQLDDSLAMLPDRRLSSFDEAVVEARLSRSGQANAQSGDLHTASDVVRTRAARSLALVISKVIS